MRNHPDVMNNIQTIYADGSGAPAVVKVRGWTYSLDFLGEVRCQLLSQTSSTKPPQWAALHARQEYLTELEIKATPEWFELNRAMYAPANMK